MNHSHAILYKYNISIFIKESLKLSETKTNPKDSNPFSAKPRNLYIPTQKHRHLTKQALDSSKMKEVADDYFKCDENGRKFSKRVENTEGKGENAQKTCTADT